jgi:hypothetical protein
MMAKLTLEDVVAWATERGFEQQADGTLAMAYKDGRVEILPLQRAVRISIEKGGVTMKLAAVNPGRLHIDEYGMLAGAGLSTSFLANLRSDADIPGWFTAQYRALAVQLLARRLSRGPDRLANGESS